jgi:multiple sugar transport system permease protein
MRCQVWIVSMQQTLGGDANGTGMRGRDLALPNPQKLSIGKRIGRWVERNTGLVFLLPAGAVLGLLLIFPLAYTIYYSVHNALVGSLSPAIFVGFKNYAEMLGDPLFRNAVLRTFAYTGLALTGELVLGVGMALIFDGAFFGRNFARAAFLLPMVATPVAISLVWLLMFDPSMGVLNYFLSLLHLPPSEWVSNPRLAIASLVLVDIWQWTPLVMLITLSGLAVLPLEPYEAAVIDGASSFQRFWYITLPLLRPYIVVAALFRGIDAMKSFDSLYVITGGGPDHASETLNLYIYNNAFEYLHISYASAMVVVFFFIVLALSLILIALRRGE